MSISSTPQRVANAYADLLRSQFNITKEMLRKQGISMFSNGDIDVPDFSALHNLFRVGYILSGIIDVSPGEPPEPVNPPTSFTFDDFLTGVLCAWRENGIVRKLPVKEKLSEPLAKVFPKILDDVKLSGITLHFHFRVDNWGYSSILEEAKHGAWSRGLLELRVYLGVNTYWITDLAVPVFGTFSKAQRDFFRRTSVLWAGEFPDVV